MKDTELKRMRDEDLYRTYVHVLGEQCFPSVLAAADYARKQPAPEYYISSRTASLLIGKIQNGISLMDLHVTSRRRVWQLYDNYMAYLKEHPGCKLSREIILETLVEQPAPEFYLSAGRAKHIIVYQRRIARQKMMKKLR